MVFGPTLCQISEVLFWVCFTNTQVPETGWFITMSVGVKLTLPGTWRRIILFVLNTLIMPKSLVSLSSDIDPPCDFACAYDKGQVPSVWKTHATSPRDYFSSSVSFPRTWSTTSFMVSPLCLPKPTSGATCLPISCVHNAGHLSKILEKKTC